MFVKAEREFLLRTHTEAHAIDYEKFAETLGVEVQNLLQFKRELAFGTMISFNLKSKSSMADIIAEQILNPELELPDLKIAIKNLSPQQRVILGLRYGILHLASTDDLDSLKSKYPGLQEASPTSRHTLQEIGTIFKLTRERIRKIEEEILDKVVTSLEKYQTKLHWIPISANIPSLKELLSYLLENKQKSFKKFDEFAFAVLYRLRSERFNYRDREQFVLTDNENEILNLRLGLFGAKPGLGDVAMLLCKKRNRHKVSKMIEDVRVIETKAIRKILSFFNSKNTTELKNFFSPPLKEPSKYNRDSRNIIIAALKKYLAGNTLI